MPLPDPPPRIVIPSPPAYPASSSGPHQSAGGLATISTLGTPDSTSTVTSPAMATGGLEAGSSAPPGPFSSSSPSPLVDYHLLTVRLLAVAAVTVILALTGWADVPYTAITTVRTGEGAGSSYRPAYEVSSSTRGGGYETLRDRLVKESQLMINVTASPTSSPTPQPPTPSPTAAPTMAPTPVGRLVGRSIGRLISPGQIK